MAMIVIAAAGLAEMSSEDERWFLLSIVAHWAFLLLGSAVPLFIFAVMLWRLVLLPLWSVLRNKEIP